MPASPTTTVRVAKAADIPELYDLLTAMVAERQEFPLKPRAIQAALKSAFNPKRTDIAVTWFVAVHNKKIVGCSYLQPVHGYMHNRIFYCWGGLYIMPELRRQNVASVLVNFLKTWAKKHGGVEIFLHTHPSNHSAHKLFTTLGFQQGEYQLWYTSLL